MLCKWLTGFDTKREYVGNAVLKPFIDDKQSLVADYFPCRLAGKVFLCFGVEKLNIVNLLALIQ